MYDVCLKIMVVLFVCCVGNVVIFINVRMYNVGMYSGDSVMSM